MKVLQGLQRLSDEEGHLLLHQLVVGDQVVEQTAVLQPAKTRTLAHVQRRRKEGEAAFIEMDLQLEDQHQRGGRLVRVQQRHQLVMLHVAEDVRLVRHLLLLLHLFAHKLNRNLDTTTVQLAQCRYPKINRNI